MRHIKLIISSLIAMVGIIIYFVSIPTINEETLVHLTVEAGNEELLDDIYFTGFLQGANYYNSFQMNSDQDLVTYENLPFFEKLDASPNQSLNILQEKYPEVVNELNYNNKINDFYILNSEDELISAYFKISDSNYYMNHSTVYLNALNKETNESTENEIARENYPDGDYVNIVGMYEEYPVVKILYNTSTWNMDTGEKSKLTVGEYNFETKDYSENSLLNEDGGFSEYGTTPYSLKNNELQIIHHYENETYNTTNAPNVQINPSVPNAYVYDFVEDTLLPLENSKTNYFVGNGNQLYTLENEEEVLLREHDQTEQKIINEIPLEFDFSLNLQEEYPTFLTEVVNDQLFVIQNEADKNNGMSLLSSNFQVFDIHSGESLLTGKIDYDTESEVNATEATINLVGSMSDFGY